MVGREGGRGRGNKRGGGSGNCENILNRANKHAWHLLALHMMQIFLQVKVLLNQLKCKPMFVFFHWDY